MIKKLLSLIISSFIFLFSSSPLLAAENWIINNYHSQIFIQNDGRVRVLETINVDFGSENKHGIFRDIPYIYPTDNNQSIYTELEVLSVNQDNVTAKYQISKYGNYLRLKIGDPNSTISGKHTYKIDYLATGVLRSFEEHDELYWDVTGNGWPVPISEASATVILPKDGIVKGTCFQGIFGAKDSCSYSAINQKQANFSTIRTLEPSEGLTLVLGFKKGLVPIITPTPPANYDNSYLSTVNTPNL